MINSLCELADKFSDHMDWIYFFNLVFNLFYFRDRVTVILNKINLPSYEINECVPGKFSEVKGVSWWKCCFFPF